MIAVADNVFRVKVADLETYATKLMGGKFPWEFRHSGHRGEQTIEYIVTGITSAKRGSVEWVLAEACRAGCFPPGLVLVDCTRPFIPHARIVEQQIEQDRLSVLRFANMAGGYFDL